MPGADAQRLRLPDGRWLGYAEYGAGDGPPLLYFHGLPGSRLEIATAAPEAERLGVRLLALDRPGVGLSDPQPGRRLLDWPEDVRACADALGLARFRVLGVSGGGPYALACARQLAGRVPCAGVVCGLGPPGGAETTQGMNPLEHHLLNLAGHAPALATPLLHGMAWHIQAFPGHALDLAAALGPPADRRTLQGPELRDSLLRSLREAFRQGAAGAIADVLLYSRPWEFSLEDIPTPVFLWQGEQDHIVPPGMGRDQARRLPACQARFYPHEGHFSLPYGHLAEILETLAGCAPPACRSG